MDDAEEVARVRKALNELGEHYDSVQIFCNRHESGEANGTYRIALGTGNFYARYGQVRQWLIAEDRATQLGVEADD